MNKFRLILFQIFYSFLVMLVGILSAWQILFSARSETRALEKMVSEEKISIWEFLFAFFIVTIILFFSFKVFRGRAFFEFVFYLILAFGIFIIFWSFLPAMMAGFLTALIIIINALYYKVWIHNLVIILGVAGISVNIGLRVSVLAALIILAVLSIYDYIAVYKTKHMTKLFYRLKERGVVLSLVIPQKTSDLSREMKGVEPGSDFMFLGTGDLALPLIFAISALFVEIKITLMIVLGALIGIILTQLLFILQKERKPMPALPTISLFSILGYLFSILL